MKAVVVPNQWSRSGGLEIVTQDIVQSLCNLGFDVLILPAMGQGTDGLWESGSRILSPGKASVKWMSPSNRIMQSLWFRYLRYPLIAKQAERFLEDGDVLILGHVHLLKIIDYLNPKKNIKKIVWTHGDEVWNSLAVQYSPWLNRLDVVVAVSNDTAGHLKRGGVITSIVTIHNSIDTRRFVPTKTPSVIRRNEVLICSRIPENFEYKGHVRLLDMLPIAESYLGAPVYLRIVGGGAGLDRLKRIVKERGLLTRVTITGKVSDEELIEAYQHCGVFCMPSDNEGFGLVYAEAEACARPVVVSTIGGAPETIIDGETGILADPFDIEANAKAIADIIKDNAKADAMGVKGHKFVNKEFSFETFRDKVQNLLSMYL